MVGFLFLSKLAFTFYVLFQEHILTIEDGIREFMNPIAYDEDAGGAAQHQVEHNVAMSINEEVDVGMRFQIILGVEHQRFLVLAHIFRLATILALHTAMLRPCQAEIDTPTGMKHRKEEL